MNKIKRHRNPNNGNNNELERFIGQIEREIPSRVHRKQKGEQFRKMFGYPSSYWKEFITTHLRKAGLKGRTFQEAQEAMIAGAKRWRLARAKASPIYPTIGTIPNGILEDFDIMRYTGPDEHDYYPHRVRLRHRAKVILLSPKLLKRKDVPVLTRGKGYIFEVDKGDLAYVPHKLTKQQEQEMWKEYEAYLRSPEAKRIAKKYGL